MDKIDVILTVPRSGMDGSHLRGARVPVGLLEAGRMLRQGAIEKPDAKELKAIAAAEKAAGIETAEKAEAPAPETAGKAGG